MLTLKRILVPIDFSRSSDAAIALALSLAQSFDAEILVLHAYEIPAAAYPTGPMIAIGDLSEAIECAAEAGVRATVEKMKETRPLVTSAVRPGRPWRVILEVADEWHADLIVMGNHSKHGIAEALLGSVTEKVIRAGHLPVLTAKSEALHSP
jgi:nucleotide-binding universal stress UspA family protein